MGWLSGRSRSIAAALAAVALAGTADADGEVAGLLLPGERVSSSLAGAGDGKVVGIAGVEGSKLDIVVTVPHGSRVVPRLSMLDPAGERIDLAGSSTRTARSARVRGVAVDRTGVWRVGVETAPGRSGAFTLTTKASVPLRFHWKSVTNAAAPDDHVFPALPGGRVTIVAAAKGRAFNPSVELMTPSGAVAARAAGVKGSVALDDIPLAEFGRHTVRVSGGTGEVTAKVTVRPAPKRRLVFRDVESRPDITGFDPPAATNQSTLTLAVRGVGFAGVASAALVRGSQTFVVSAVKDAGDTSASATLDLDAVAPGTYSIRLTTAEGNSVDAPHALTLTNRTPAVGLVTPVDTTAGAAFSLDVHGAGFDDTAGLFLRRASDGTEVPLSISSRTGHGQIVASASPPLYLTGPCDVEVRDPDGLYVVSTGRVDLLGLRAAPADLASYQGTDASNAYVREAALDETHGRVLVGFQPTTKSARFVLFDLATSSVVDSFDVDLGSGSAASLFDPRVAWDPVGGTFSMTLGYATASSNDSFLFVVPDTDIQNRIAAVTLAGADSASVAANPRDGGYLVAFRVAGTGSAKRLVTQPISPSGTIDTTRQKVLATHALGWLWRTAVVGRADGTFLVAWIGATDDDQFYAVRASSAAADGTATTDPGAFVAATSVNWTVVDYPGLVRSPDDGSILVTFSYAWELYHPGCVRLAPGSLVPGAPVAVDEGFASRSGEITSAVWNPARKEFVLAYVTYDGRTGLRRVNPNGSLRPASGYGAFDGVLGALYAGSSQDSLGLARAVFAVEYDGQGIGHPTARLLAGPLR